MMYTRDGADSENSWVDIWIWVLKFFLSVQDQKSLFWVTHASLIYTLIFLVILLTLRT